MVLDGHLLGETPAEVNFHELIRTAQSEFRDVKTLDENDLEQDWPRLRAALGNAFIKWKCELHESVKQTHVANIPLWRQHFLR